MKMKRTMHYIVGGLTACGLLLTACDDANKDFLHIIPPSEKPAPAPEPEPEQGLDLSACCELFRQFVAAREAGEESTLLDFSYAGYEFGERPVPDVTYREYKVDDYGAVPNDGQSDRDAVQAAIDAAVSAGGKAVVRFSAGRYNLRPADAANKALVINGDNIVLRGAGSGEGGTEIFMEYPNEVVDATLWNAPALLQFTYSSAKGGDTDPSLYLAEVVGDAPRGSKRLEVVPTGGLSIGQRVLLLLDYNNDPELVADEVRPYDIHSEWTELPNTGVKVAEYHVIDHIDGGTITFKEPMVHKVEARWGWKLYRHQCHIGNGVEDLCFRGNFQKRFEHHGSALDDSGYRTLLFHRQANGWVRRCRFVDVSEAVSVQISANVSVTECTLEGNQGHSAIRAEASSRIFMGKLTDKAGQYHSFGVSKTAAGNVLWRSVWTPLTCFESHCSQPRATLIDVCKGGFLPNHAGGDAALGPNHLADLTVWNFCQTGFAFSSFDLWVRNNRFLRPVFAGFQGTTQFRPEQVTADESHGTAVLPESLYEAQLMQRLGYLPDWVMQLKAK